MTREQAIAKLMKEKKSYDSAQAHWEADQVLCKLLTSLGYSDVVKAWDAITPKWYA